MIDFHKTSLVNQFSYTLLVRIPPGDVRFTDTEHIQCSLKRINRSLKPFSQQHTQGKVSQKPESKNQFFLAKYLVQLDENAVIDLPESEQLKGFANLRMNLVDTIYR